jgi:Sulfatase-modifying factor enzyme 1
VPSSDYYDLHVFVTFKLVRGGVVPPPPTPDDIEMFFIQGGTFMMGSDNGSADEKPPHQVKLPDFYIGKYEVTQKQWRTIMGSDPSELYNKGCDNCPVEEVDYYEAKKFISELNQKTRKPTAYRPKPNGNMQHEEGKIILMQAAIR